jgi:glycosyltransferase involved in cell wall biosynthesis
MEQLGRAAIEAMAMGVPVIVSNSGALPEVVGSAATVFQENSVQSLIDKIELLKRNPALYQSTSFAGKMRGRCYTWDRFAEQIAQFYNSLI